jgi:hypothetical protein
MAGALNNAIDLVTVWEIPHAAGRATTSQAITSNAGEVVLRLGGVA